MFRQKARILIAGLVMMLLTGCFLGSYNNNRTCYEDGDCISDQKCIDSQCTSGGGVGQSGASCNSDNDCTTGTWCAESICTLSRDIACQVNDDCPPDADCDTAEGGCTLPRNTQSTQPNGGCRSDSDCRGKEHCNLDTGKCFARREKAEVKCTNACMGSKSQGFSVAKSVIKMPKKTILLKKMTKQDALDRLMKLSATERLIINSLFISKSNGLPKELIPLKLLLQKHAVLNNFLKKKLQSKYRHLFVMTKVDKPNLISYLKIKKKFLYNNPFETPEAQCVPMLQLRLDRVTVHEEDDDWAKDEIYCIIQAVSDYESQYVATPIVGPLSKGQTAKFPRDRSWIWGKEGTLYYPGPSLTVHIQCIEKDDGEYYSKLLNEINKYVSAAETLFGWINPKFGALLKTTSLILDIVAAVWALDGDDKLFNAKLLINSSSLAEYANREIEVRKNGTNKLSDWDWSIFIESKSCQQ